MTGPAVPLLECSEVSKHFGGVAAVDGVSLSIPHNGLFGLAGLNGAGKSTLFNLLAGALLPDTGSVTLAGTDVTRLPAARRARLGLSRTWQIVHLVEDRSTLDNVAVACLAASRQPMIRALARSQLGQARERAWQALTDFGLGDVAGRAVGTLTLEKQRLVELARAVAPGPAVVLADEPASGLSKSARGVLSDALAQLAQARAVVMIEHDIDMLERLSQRMWVLASGRVVFAGTPAEFTQSPERARLRSTRGAAT